MKQALNVDFAFFSYVFVNLEENDKQKRSKKLCYYPLGRPELKGLFFLTYL